MAVLGKLSARAKLLLSFMLVCTILGGVSGFALIKMGLINDTVGMVYNEQLLPISALGKTQLATNIVRRVGEFSTVEKSPEVLQRNLASVAEARKQFTDQYIGVVIPVATAPEEKALTVKVQEHFSKYCDLAESMTNLAIKNDVEGAKALQTEFAAVGDSLLGELSEEAVLNEGYARDGLITSEKAYSTAFTLVSSLVVAGTLIGLAIGWMISRWFTKALLEVSAIADGVASASQQLAAAAEELSSGAQEQASSLEETASSLEEITGTIQQNSDNAQQANQLAGKSRRVAENGGEVVGRAVQGMGEINTASKKIADIITAIDEIAFQTNLLALNAAVEAARAGEQGRGFAVVAGEVRNLAQRSAVAAKEIKSLIQQSVSKVETGSELVNKSGHTLSEIVTSVNRVTDIVSEIASASREQASGIEQVNRAVAQMDTVVQTYAAQTEELTSTAEELAGQASKLQELVSQFNLTKKDAGPVVSKQVAVRKTLARTPVRKPQAPKPPKPQTRKSGDEDLEAQVEHELELLSAATSGGGDGFEKF